MNTEFCVISHTHWDREWHMSFEQFRMRLVSLMDNLLDIMKDEPSYVFHLDAQSICVEDYLEIRPSREEELRRYISEGRILIGPWYVQNDFYLTSAEATVRNLMIGTKMSKDYGRCDTAGYAPDQFGNISQLPQILRGFGIDNFIFGRGYRFPKNPGVDREEERRPLEFYWTSKDGSRVLAIHLADWYNNAQRFPADIDVSVKLVEGIEGSFKGRATTPHLLLMNGVDHVEAQEDLLPILREVAARLPSGKQIGQDTLAGYVKKVQAHIQAEGIGLEEYQGELRNGWDIQTFLAGTASSRIYLKTQNARAQVLLENELEPLYTMIAMLGATDTYPHDYLLYLWKTLIKNHPHDSICGCSRDEVNANMEDRNLRIFEAGSALLRRGTAFLSDHADRSKMEAGDYVITLVNTIDCRRSAPVDVDIIFPRDDAVRAFSLRTLDGAPLEHTVVEKRKELYNSLSPLNLPGMIDVDVFRTRIFLSDLPAFSVSYLKVTPEETGESAPEGVEEDVTSGTIENEHVELKVGADGTADLLHKKTGCVYRDFFSLEETGDRGSSYEFILPEEGAVFSSKDFAIERMSTKKSPLQQQISIEYTAMLPECFDHSSKKRAATKITNTVRLDMILRKGSRHLELKCHIENRSRDHRMRFVLNSGIDADHVQASAPFEILERKNTDHIPGWNSGDCPHSGFVTISDGQRGISVLTEGLCEYRHDEGHPGRIAFTLVRGTGAINRDITKVPAEWTCPENQCLRDIDVRFAVYPHGGDACEAETALEFKKFLVPILTHYDAWDMKKFAGGRPPVQAAGVSLSFFREPEHPDIIARSRDELLDVAGEDICVTALKRSEDGTKHIVRFYNSSDHKRECRITFFKTLSYAEMVDLKERPTGPLPWNGKSIGPVELRPGQIMTVAFK